MDHYPQQRATYLYVRWMLALLPAVLFVVTVASSGIRQDLPGSISAYYGSPVRDVFVGVMVAVAVCLVAYQGDTPLEDYNFNGGGFYAACVALIPTTYAVGSVDDVWSLRCSVTVVALLAAVLLAREWATGKLAQLWEQPSRVRWFIGVTFATLIAFLAMTLWQLWTPPAESVTLDGLTGLGIPLRVHDLAAILLICALAVSVLMAGERVIFGAMVVGPLAAWGLSAAFAPGHFVILLEWWEIVCFCVFWVRATLGAADD